MKRVKQIWTEGVVYFQFGSYIKERLLNEKDTEGIVQHEQLVFGGDS